MAADGPDHKLVGVGDWNWSPPPPQIRALCVAYAVRQPHAHGMPRRRRPRPCPLVGESGSSLGQQASSGPFDHICTAFCTWAPPPVWVAQNTAGEGDCRWFITGGVSVHVSEPTLFNFPTNLGGVWS